MKEVIKKLINILDHKFNVKCKTDNEIMNSPLTGCEFALDAIQMVQFLICIENEFHIYFTPSDMEEYSFKTLTDIQKAVIEKQRCS